ncbi:flagellar basal body P-ring formation chaperone FlgA [Marinomonas sp. 15G1-11]|uniref:Flagella basal body P-ring formation protein FlgA n=1 Tax=Marinomonas phaeophyticola TaxID=3004091 RepID=A0ABT4JT03_9GAMM|nr:flagellar basal body P-ring formation chaperone FlgA [Marinomonas sp. 15G1-11]MCZ2721187.1 flagellar basal body P-ring formation chaperone FlgA [Marinomonas sp. 15G1-11]
MNKKIFSLVSIICSFSSVSSATDLQRYITDFIEHHEKPRLAELYPQADVNIELENRADFSYLPTCSEENLSIINSRQDAQKRTTYTVECFAPAWKFYVPVNQMILLEAYVAITPISRKQPISSHNTDLIQVDITKLRGDIYNKENPPFGFVASRNININTVITDKLTELPIIVKKGSRVMIKAQSNAISVRMNGESLENGTLGQQIRVKNISSGRIVYGKVVSSNEILVNY